MAEQRFIKSSEVSPFDLATYKQEVIIQIMSRAWYYEWNDRDQKWAKLNEQDPEPPADLKPGRFDGQIVEIARTPAK